MLFLIIIFFVALIIEEVAVDFINKHFYNDK